MYDEFLDTEWYNNVTPFRSPPKLENFLLPTWMVKEFSQPSRMRKIAVTDADVFNDLRPDISTNGVLVDLIIKIDNQGRMTLFDGHHRLQVALEQGIPELPVRFEVCEKLSIESRKVGDVLPLLLRSVK